MIEITGTNDVRRELADAPAREREATGERDATDKHDARDEHELLNKRVRTRGREGTDAFIKTTPGAVATQNSVAPASAHARVSRLLERAIFRLLLVLLVAVVIPYGSVDPWWDGVAVGSVFALAALWMIEGALRGTWFVEEHKSLLPLVALAAFALAQALPVFGAQTIAGVRFSAALSADPFETRAFALKLFALALLAAMLLRYTSSARRLRAVVYTILFAGLLSAALGFARWALTKETLAAIAPRLAANVGGFAQFINRNHFALLAEISIGAATALLLAVRRRRERVLVYLAALLALWVALVMSVSRGGILGACAALATAAFLYLSRVRTNSRAGDDRVRASDDEGDARVRRRRSAGEASASRRDRSNVRSRRTRRAVTTWLVRVALVASVFAFALAGVLWAGGERLAARLESVPVDVGASGASVRWGDRRTEIWRASWKLFTEHPLAGAGLAAYRAGVTCCHDASGEMSLEQAHDEYLEVLASGGLIAAALVAWQAFLFARRARRTLRSNDSTRRALAAGALAGLVAVAIHSLFDFGLHVTANAFLFVALASTLVVGRRADEAAGGGNCGLRIADCGLETRSPSSITAASPSTFVETPIRNPQSAIRNLLVCFLVAALFVWGAWRATRAGASRLLSETATRLAGTEYEGEATRLAAEALSLSPADPEAHYAFAVAASRRGDDARAVVELERAASLRPGYYLNWLKLGRARERAGDTGGALEAFDEAARLAPAYAEPHWQAGNALLRAGRLEEAFAELRRAASSRPALLPYTAELAWRANAGDAAATLRALAPATAETHAALAHFFVKHGEREAAIEEYRASRVAFTDEARGALVSEMFAAGMYREAREVWSERVGARDSPKGDASARDVATARDATTAETNAVFGDAVFNGGFESRTGADEPGFDWRFRRDARAVSFALDGATPHAGARSLLIEFGGEADVAARLVSQTVLVEPGARYILRFAARTEGLKSGGMPVVAVLKATGDEALAQSDALPQDTAGAWREFGFEFRADSEAVTIAFRRAGCTSPVCPVFGRAWLDDFELRKL